MKAENGVECQEGPRPYRKVRSVESSGYKDGKSGIK